MQFDVNLNQQWQRQIGTRPTYKILLYTYTLVISNNGGYLVGGTYEDAAVAPDYLYGMFLEVDTSGSLNFGRRFDSLTTQTPTVAIQPCLGVNAIW